MVGSAGSIARVPLRDVLPGDYAAAEDRLRSLAVPLEIHGSAAGRIVWHWYPDHVEPPPAELPQREYRMLLDAVITLMSTGYDWLDLTLDLAWTPELSVNAAVEVACWCQPDHNMHQVRDAQWPVASVEGLVEGFAAAIAMLTDVLDSGPFDPSPWRDRAGLPDAPAAAAGWP
jgi:hypothetical protein